jgi:hypothetical protein
MAVFYERVNERFDSIKGWEFIGQLRFYQLFKVKSAPFRWSTRFWES